MKITCEIGEDRLHDLDDMDAYQRNVVLPENEHQETIHSTQGSALSDNFGCFDPGTESHCTGTVSNNEYFIGQDFVIARKRFENESLPMNEMSDSNYRSLVQSLNEKQKLFFFHNIGGNTIHSAFGIPVGRGFAFKPLDMHQLDSMRCKFFHLKIVFIDEILMVGKT